MTRERFHALVPAIVACLSLAPLAQQPPLSVRDSKAGLEAWLHMPDGARSRPDDVLVWGRGLQRVNLTTGEVTEWLDDSHVIDDVCWAGDHGTETDTVFVLEGGQVTRLYADTGGPVRLIDPSVDPQRPVLTQRVIDLVGSGCAISALQLDLELDGSGTGRPFWSSAYTSIANSGSGDTQLDGSRESFVMVLDSPGPWLDVVPDRIDTNQTLSRSCTASTASFAAFAPPDGAGLRLWDANGDVAPRLARAANELPPSTIDFVMPTSGKRCYALVETSRARERDLMALSFPAGLATAFWSPLDIQPGGAIGEDARLYLSDADGSRLLVGSRAGLVVVDGLTGDLIAEFDLKGLAATGSALLDATLIDLPHDDERHPYTPGSATEVCFRDEAWVCGLIRGRIQGEPTRLVIWEWASGKRLRTLDVPERLRQVTTLPQDLTERSER